MGQVIDAKAPDLSWDSSWGERRSSSKSAENTDTLSDGCRGRLNSTEYVYTSVAETVAVPNPPNILVPTLTGAGAEAFPSPSNMLAPTLTGAGAGAVPSPLNMLAPTLVDGGLLPVLLPVQLTRTLGFWEPLKRLVDCALLKPGGFAPTDC